MNLFALPRTTLRKLVFFAASGLAAFGVDACLLALLCHLGVSPYVARVASISVAMGVAWYGNRTFTFRLKTKPTVAEFGKYALLGWSVAAVNYLTFAGLVGSGFIPWPVGAAALATAFSMSLSFIGMSKAVFAPPKPRP